MYGARYSQTIQQVNLARLNAHVMSSD